MRIISGKYKGKKLLGYDIEGTRPTQDRVKESLFGMIQSELVDSKVLDLFAGSGNLGIEALSMGASFAYFVDNNKKCIEVLEKNIESIPKEQVTIIRKDYYDALMELSSNKVKFNIIFLDPPYNLECLNQVLELVIKNNLLEEDGLIICEYEFNQFKENYPGLALEKEKKYGYKNIRIYRKETL